MENSRRETILILDFGSQVTQLIARRIREQSIYCEIHPCDISAEWLAQFAQKQQLRGIILSGSHASVYQTDAPTTCAAVLSANVPVLGICYGMQWMAQQLGGKVRATGKREFGLAHVRARGHSALLRDIADATTAEGHGMLEVWMSHGDSVVEFPADFQLLASTPSCPIAGMFHAQKSFYGLQFHPEVTHTRQGAAILQRFVQTICGCTGSWQMPEFVAEAVQKIRAAVGEDHVLLGLSGGVDSSVAAALIHRAIGKRLTCVFVDHGLLRLNEAAEVRAAFAPFPEFNVHFVDAATQFFEGLKGLTDPEEKRKVIGREFVAAFLRAAAAIKTQYPERPIRWLAQGTIYPDVIESGGGKKGGPSQAIKSHHNVGGLPEQLGLSLLEPLRLLFKDEVRALGAVLGLPRELLWRHPFPGPGLGVRILGEIRADYANILRQADAIFIEELRRTTCEHSGKTWYDLVSQAFAVFLPVKSVGVKGDGRCYEYVIALRAVQTTDFMTANMVELPYPLLKKVSNRITNEVAEVSRVVFDLSSKPPATIEWE